MEAEKGGSGMVASPACCQRLTRGWKSMTSWGWRGGRGGLPLVAWWLSAVCVDC